MNESTKPPSDDVPSNSDIIALFQHEEAPISGLAGMTYGEIEINSVTMFLKFIQIEKHEIIMDIGSGMGAVCIQIALETEAKKITGVEYVQERHDLAINSKNQLATEYEEINEKLNLQKRIKFSCADATRMFFDGIDVIFFCCMAWEAHEVRKTLSRVLDSDEVRVIVTVGNLEQKMQHPKTTIKLAEKVKRVDEYHCDTTWGDSKLFIYWLRDPPPIKEETTETTLGEN